jgi:hypothetical protein
MSHLNGESVLREPHDAPSTASWQALQRIAALPPDTSWKRLPRKKLAGVMVLLYIDSEGDLRVLLTTRAMTLRSHPGDTALPGGRVDEGDANIEATAVRSASGTCTSPHAPRRNGKLAKRLDSMPRRAISRFAT